MNVMFYDPFIPDGGDQSVGFERLETLEELLRESDIVTVHTPLTDETRGMLNGQALSCMKKDAILINTSRGEVVDVDAVTEALKADRLAAAGLAGRVIVTPLAAWYSPDGARDCREKAARTVINYLTEGTIRNCVNEQFLKQGDAL